MDHEGVVGGHTPFGHMGERGADRLELAQRHPDLVDDLGAVGGHPPTALAGVGPPLGDLGRRVGQQGDMEEDRGHAGLADLAPLHGPSQRGLACVPAELAPEQVDESRILRRGQHGPALGGVAGEGLLAQHVLAGGDGGQGDGRVGVGRGGDGHRRHTVQADGLLHRGEAAGDVEQRGPGRGLGRIAADQGHHVEPGLPEGPHVGDAPEPGPDHHHPAHQ